MSNFPFQCEIHFGDQTFGTQQNVPSEIRHVYKMSGVYRVRSVCSYQSSRLFSQTSVIVEEKLRAELLKLTYDNQSASYPNILCFTHERTPLRFQFALKKGGFRLNGTSFFLQEPQLYFFNVTLNKKTKNKLGPGLHEFDLVLENHISAYYFSSFFVLSRQIDSFNISSHDFFQHRPGRFLLLVKARDFPVEIEVQMKDFASAPSRLIVKKNCLRNCANLPVEGLIPQLNKTYFFIVIVSNSNSSIFKTIDVTFTSQVYDVYLTSLRTVQISEITQLLLLISADEGFYDATMRWRDQVKQFQINVSESLHSIDIEKLKLPGYLTNYHQHQVNVSFHAFGLQEIGLTFRHLDQEFKFKQKLVVANNDLCQPRIHTRLNRNTSWMKKRVLISNTLILSADVQVDECQKLDGFVVYAWEMSKISSLDDPVLSRDNNVLNDNINDSEFYLEPSLFEPGLYVIKLSVALHYRWTGKIGWMMDDFTLAEIVQRKKLNFQILGGYLREAGKILNKSKLV